MFRLSMPLLALTLGACAQMLPPEEDPGQEYGSGSPGEAPLERGGKPVPPKSDPLPPEQVRVAPGIERQNCDAEPAQRFVGRMSSDAVVAEVRAASGARVARVIGHDMMVTMDYSGDRVNVQLDEDGRIVAITCG